MPAAVSSRWISAGQSGCMLEQTLSGPHAREGDRLHRHLAVGANAGIGRRLQRPALRKIVAVMRAARILPRERRLGDHAAHGDQALEVEPVVPAQIESPRRGADASALQLALEPVELAERSSEALLV